MLGRMHLRFHLVPALVLVLPWVAACGGDDDDDESAMTQGDDMAPADDMAADDDTGAEQASDDDAPSDPSGGPNADPAPVTSAAAEELIADVCERGEECTGESTQDCLAEGAAAIGLLVAVCPDLIVSFLECAAESPTCDPEVDCASEGMALQNCGLDGAPVVDEATIQMACEVYSSCVGEDAATCVEEFAAGGAALERVCPGGFAPYIECIAAMTGCDREVECAEEIAVLEECGLSMKDRRVFIFRRLQGVVELGK
jgi:hypothetical protein